MSHHTSEEEATLQAALFAFGVLPQEEAEAFQQHLAEGCPTCKVEVQSFQLLAEKLAFAAPRVEPPARLRDRLWAEITGESASPQPAKPVHQSLGESLTIRANEGEWNEKWEGVFIKRLFKDDAKGTVTTLYKLLPGASLPKHRHLGAEECLVLEGDYHINGEVLGAGDYHCALPGSVDESLFTIHGTMFLIVSPERYAAV
ncbi:MAG: cupin domain-containing protein [Acidobacteria bacterium]|nr:cupin domain-containing protein [Acidobacteriota bacterium]